MNTNSHHVQHGPGRVSVGVFPASQADWPETEDDLSSSSLKTYPGIRAGAFSQGE